MASHAEQSFTRPADITAYTSGDLVANSTTAGSVVPLSFPLQAGLQSRIEIDRARIRKSGTSIANASFRVHFFMASPTVTNGDNGAFIPSQGDNHIGYIDVIMDVVHSAGALGWGGQYTGVIPEVHDQYSPTIYVLIEARGAYTPVSGEVFTVAIECHKLVR